MRLTGFGRFRDLFLSFPGHFQIVLGGNETGKTTIVDAVAGILFGFRRGQKDLRERYRPWHDPSSYQASLVLEAEDGTRYLIGRDFHHDRVEVFRGEGIRLEPLTDADLERVLEDGLGFASPQLFESTLILRQAELAALGRDRTAAGRLAELLGRKPAGGEEEAAAARALQALRDKLADLDRAAGGDSLPALQDKVAALERDLAEIEGSHSRHAELVVERDRLQKHLAMLERELADAEGRMSTARAAAARAEARAHLATELAAVQAVLARMAEPLGNLARTRDQLQGAPGADVLGRAEDLAGQIAGLEVELRYEEESIRQYQAETIVLEEEIAKTRSKLETLDRTLLGPEIQNRLAALLPSINEHTARLGGLLPAVDKLLGKLRSLKRLRVLGFLLSFASCGAALAATEYATRPQALAAAGLGGVLTVFTAAMVINATATRKAAAHLSAEIDRRQSDLKTKRAEVDRLLQGKTLSQYQAETEAARFYRHDLWSLEQTLAQKQAQADPEKTRAIEEGLQALKNELAGLLAAAGCRGLDELRAAAARQAELEAAVAQLQGSLAHLGEGRSYDELLARERELREQLGALGPAPSAEEEAQYGAAAERSAWLAGEIETLRRRVAELDREIANYHDHVLPKDRAGIEADLELARHALAHARAIRDGVALAIRRLEGAVFATQTELGPELEARTGEALSRLTGGRYREVGLDFPPSGLEVKVRAPETGALIEAAALSGSVLDQLYLALRIGLAHYLTRGGRFPLILDDPFTSFDRQRLRQTVDCMVDLASEHQIIWLTRDPALAGMVREAGLEPGVEELPG